MTGGDRKAYLAFVRAHHPDRGGDHETFLSGLARFGIGTRNRGTAPLSDDDPRLNCPVVIVHRPRGLSLVLELVRNVRKPPAPPRVR